MASWQLYTTADASLYAPTKPPVYGVEGGRKPNVVSGTTLGGKVKTQIRGADRRTLSLTWQRIPLVDVEGLDTVFATYGASKAALKLEVPAGALPNVAGGTKLRVRWIDDELVVRWVAYGSYTVTARFVEDLV